MTSLCRFTSRDEVNTAPKPYQLHHQADGPTQKIDPTAKRRHRLFPRARAMARWTALTISS